VRRTARLEAGLERYLNELKRRGRRTNLVGTASDEALARHVEDSLAAAEALPRGVRVVDLGSGAGFPGIPIALARADLRVTLVEIRERRVHFLRHAVRTLDLDCAIVRQRIEDPPPERFDVVLLRAVAPPAEALASALPWAAEGGEIWIWARSRPGGLPGDPGRDLSLGERGVILRIPASSVPRGTPES
jgi:16S rRNA (guanine527-N7)-methyltransferase